MSLTDELLADLDELGDDVEDEEEESEEEYQMDMNGEENEEDEEDEDKMKDLVEELQTKDITKIAKLYSSKTFQECMKKIAEFKKVDNPNFSGNMETNPEYKVIVLANKLLVDIDNEIIVIHKFIRDLYATKFPELESLVMNQIDYTRVILLLGNKMELTNVDELSKILPSATVMVITVTASTTSGQVLTEENWEAVKRACELTINLDQAKKEILSYIESRMLYIAPNLCHITGPTIAAKLIGAAGGLDALSKIPSCNLILIGATKKNLSGFSSVTMSSRLGYLYNCEIIKLTPQDFKNKAVRALAGKCTLAARVDSLHQNRDGSFGREMLDMVQKKIDKMQELAPGKQEKALPVPLEQARKRRGGRRARKMKEKFAVTEYRKMQNRMNFAVCEEEETMFMDKTHGIGLVSQPGKVRALTADNRTKLKSKNQFKNYAGSGLSSNVSGISSSVVFTPVKGFEINNPNLESQKEKVREANEKYFSSAGGFRKVGKKE